MMVEISEENYSKAIHDYIHRCNDEELIRLFNILKEEVNSRIAHIIDGYTKYWEQEKKR